MTEDTIDIELPAENTEEMNRECHMSIDFFQNASQTIGELRDLMRASGLSWEAIQTQIDRTQPQSSSVGRMLDSLDEYSTGIGNSLLDKQSNLRD